MLTQQSNNSKDYGTPNQYKQHGIEPAKDAVQIVQITTHVNRIMCGNEHEKGVCQATSKALVNQQLVLNEHDNTNQSYDWCKQLSSMGSSTAHSKHWNNQANSSKDCGTPTETSKIQNGAIQNHSSEPCRNKCRSVWCLGRDSAQQQRLRDHPSQHKQVWKHKHYKHDKQQGMTTPDPRQQVVRKHQCNASISAC